LVLDHLHGDDQSGNHFKEEEKKLVQSCKKSTGEETETREKKIELRDRDQVVVKNDKG